MQYFQEKDVDFDESYGMSFFMKIFFGDNFFFIEMRNIFNLWILNSTYSKSVNLINKEIKKLS
jgi:hypothetical protein